VKSLLLGRRNAAFQRYRVLLFEDRMEEVSMTLGSLEVSRLFFDEAAYATVHRMRNWPHVLAMGVLAAIPAAMAIGFAVSSTGIERTIWVLCWSLLALFLLGWLAYLVLYPPHQLVVRAPDQKFSVLLPRRKGERIIQRLVQAVEAYQAAHAPPEAEPVRVVPEPPPAA
jgi:hypothetical protein